MKFVPLVSMLVAAITLNGSSNAVAQTPGEFEVRYDLTALTTQQQLDLQPALASAANFWESVILGYQPGVFLDGVEIDVNVEDIDGTNGVLAEAGPSGFQLDQGGFVFATDSDGSTLTGELTIDSSDFQTGLIADVLNHEIAHVLGFNPLLFELNDLIAGDGQYDGEAGLAAYQLEFDPDASFIPLQNDPATATQPAAINAHLDEDNDLVDVFGRSISDELLTPIIADGNNATDPSLNFLSATSAGIFNDLGFIAVAPVPFAVPEPSSFALLAMGGLALVVLRRR
jgi:hypothetical protein